MPTGEIVAHPGRGTLTGNRGCLHTPDGRLGVSRWRSKLWICCTLDWRGRRRAERVLRLKSSSGTLVFHCTPGLRARVRRHRYQLVDLQESWAGAGVVAFGATSPRLFP